MIFRDFKYDFRSLQNPNGSLNRIEPWVYNLLTEKSGISTLREIGGKASPTGLRGQTMASGPALACPAKFIMWRSGQLEEK